MNHYQIVMALGDREKVSVSYPTGGTRHKHMQSLVSCSLEKTRKHLARQNIKLRQIYFLSLLRKIWKFPPHRKALLRQWMLYE